MSHIGVVRSECDRLPRRWFKRVGSLWRCSCGQVYELSQIVDHDIDRPSVRFWKPITLREAIGDE